MLGRTQHAASVANLPESGRDKNLVPLVYLSVLSMLRRCGNGLLLHHSPCSCSRAYFYPSVLEHPFDGGIGGLTIEPFWIEIDSSPYAYQPRVISVRFISQRIEQILVSPGATDVLGRTCARAGFDPG